MGKKPPTLREAVRDRRLNSFKLKAGSPKSPLVLGGEIWVGQVSPQVVEQAVAVGAARIEPFAAEYPELIEWVDPIARSNARPWAVAHVWVNCRAGGRRTINPRSADGGRTLYPNPLAASISPEIAQ